MSLMLEDGGVLAVERETVEEVVWLVGFSHCSKIGQETRGHSLRRSWTSNRGCCTMLGRLRRGVGQGQLSPGTK